MFLKIMSTALGIAGLAWLVLVFSSRAILVSERVETAVLRERLVCEYFTGTGSLRKEYWYSKTESFLGRAACPRWEKKDLVTASQ